MNRSYVEGFMAKCAAVGIDPEALLKLAQVQQPVRVPRQFPEQKLPSGGMLWNMFGKKTLPALPDPAAVAGKSMPSTDIKATQNYAGSVGARRRQLETISGR